MFTAMISRFYFLVGLVGLTLAVGAGWGVYELRRERAGDAPVADVAPPTEGSAAQAPADETSTRETAPPTGVADAVAPAADDARADAPAPARASDEPRAVAAPPAAPEATPAPPPASETTTSAEAAPAAEEDAAAAASGPTDAPGVETGAQIEALSSATEAEAPGPASAPSPPDPEPAVAAGVAAPAAEAEPAPSPVETGGESAAPAEGVRAEAREAPAAPEQRAGTEGVPQPVEQETIASAAPTAPDQGEVAPAPSETTDRPDEQQAVASAVPTAPGEGEAAPAADPGTSMAPPAAEPAPERAGSAALETGVPEESRPAPARAVETIKRALSALFGSAADAPVAEGAREGSAVATAPPTGPEAAAPDPLGAPEEDPAEIEPGAGPTFDIVRIAPGGQAVIAGRAPPDAEVEIRSGDRVVDRVRADRRGEWVAVPLEPLPAGDQALSLLARAKDGSAAESDEVLVVAVPEPPPPQPAPRASGEPPPPQPPEVAAGQSPSAALAMALPRDGRGQGRILQAPGRLSSDGTLALMVLDYDETGRIRLRGEAPPGAPLRIYVDNAPAGAAVVEPSGKWSTVLEPTLAPGDYTLRLDQLDPAGKPTARLETPFTRASQPPVEGDVQVDFVIVQPGNSLWRIARRLFGQGVHYVHIYDANQGQIREPDLIYPGQVFEIPSAIGAAG